MNIKKLRFLVSLVIASFVFIGCEEQSQSEVERKVLVKKTKQEILINKRLEEERKIVKIDFKNKIDSFSLHFGDFKNTVYDSSINLTWQDDKRAKTITRNWKDSIEYCKNLDFKTYNDWRLPTKNELITIVDDTRKPAIKVEFKNSTSNYYWSSFTYDSGSDFAWYIDFSNSDAYNSFKDNNYYIRCVRSGQLIFHSSLDEYKFYKSAYGKKVFVTNKSYSKKPFGEIQRLTQKLTNIYLTPREIKKEKNPPKIEKPTLPKLPKFVKDEYETKVQFQDRVNKGIEQRETKIKQLQAKYREDVEKRNKKVEAITKKYLAEVEMVKAEQKYKKTQIQSKIKEWQKNAFNVVMGGFEFQKRSYDAESETMYLTMKAKMADYSKKVAIKVPLSIAKSFGENIQNVKANPVFDFKNNQIVLNRIEANYDGNTMLATLNSKDFKPENITVAIKDKKVKFDSASQMKLSLQNPNLKDTYQVKALAYKDGKEIKGVKFDDDIPSLLANIKQTKVDSKKWLFVVGIENYAETDNIKYSKRSAEAFKKVAQKTLGISERHSYTLIDSKATGTAIKNRLRLLLSEVKKGDTVYFYYNGHGIPDPKNSGEPYMLPSDGIADFIVGEKEFALKNIYKQLSDSKASKVVAFVDSCFSGATDGVSIIKGVAGSRLAPKKVVFDKSKMAVITSGQKKQYSNMYAKKGHRLFSYFVMKSLLEGKKDINMLYKEVSYKVSNTSNEFGVLKKQEPTIDGNLKIRL